MSVDALIQGFYNPATNLMVPDTMRAYIRNIKTPYAIYDSSKAVVNDSGKVRFTFTNAPPDGEPILVQMKHRNSIEVWSKYTGTTFAILFQKYFNPFTSTLEQNFTTSQSTAFGNNLVKVDSLPNKFALYSGDVNQDGSVNLTDILAVFNDAGIFAAGYIKTDLTGDNVANLTDIILAFNNSVNFVHKITP